MVRISERRGRLIVACGVLVVVGSALLARTVFAHVSVQECTTATGCATVPTTFSVNIPLGAGASYLIPAPSNHDMRVVVAVLPDAADKAHDKNHGVAAIDLIINPPSAPETRASWTGIDGSGKVIVEANTPLAVGDVLAEANQSGTITLEYAGPSGLGHSLRVTNSGSTGQPVAIRWIH
jgi:hypothetical protein